MNTALSAAWTKAHQMFEEFIVLLPNIILAPIVFLIFFLVARNIKRLVRRLTHDRRHAHNLVLVLGKLAQGTIILIGLSAQPDQNSQMEEVYV